MPKNPDELGALWLKRGNKGPYMTGEIAGQAVVCFPADGGEGEKRPAWRVLKSKPREERPATPTSDEIGF